MNLSGPITAVIDRIGNGVRWLALVMVLLTCLIVVGRHFFGLNTIVIQELVMWCHALLFLGGIPYAMLHNEHVRVDMLYNRFKPTNRTRVNLIGTAVLLMPISVFLIWVTWPYMLASWRVLEASPEPQGLPGIFLLKSLLPLFGAILFATACLIMASHWQARSLAPPEPAGSD